MNPKPKSVAVARELNLRTKSQWEEKMDRKEEENTEMMAALADIRRRVDEYEMKLGLEM